MARVSLTKTDAPCKTQLTMAAADTTDKNMFVASGRDLVVAYNAGTGTQTVTITSTRTPDNRLGHITEHAIPEGEIHVFGPFPKTGWIQTDKSIYLEATTGIQFGILGMGSEYLLGVGIVVSLVSYVATGAITDIEPDSVIYDTDRFLVPLGVEEFSFKDDGVTYVFKYENGEWNLYEHVEYI